MLSNTPARDKGTVLLSRYCIRSFMTRSNNNCRTAMVALTAGDSIREAHSYEYDNNGNIVYVNTSRVKPDMTAQPDTVQRTREERFRWDEENRLTALSQNGYVSHYWYDADGERDKRMPSLCHNSENIFMSCVYTNATLYVPSGSLSLYNTAPVWMIFDNIIEVEAVQSTYGDLNGDGQVDISDVNMVINLMLGKVEQTVAGDVTGIEDITAGTDNADISDVNAVINVMLGK